MKWMTSACVLMISALVSACGTSGFDEIKARARAQAKVAPPKPAKSKPVKTAQARAPQKPVAQEMSAEAPPVVATATPVATELPPPGHMKATVVTSSAKFVRVPATEIIVGKGETLFAVSRRTGAAVKDIAKANNLSEPFAITPGQKIIVPEMRYYVVQPGETAARIARERGVSLTQLAAMNDLDDAYMVKQGQKLRLPLDAILPPLQEEKQLAKAAPAQEKSPQSHSVPAPSKSVPTQSEIAQPEPTLSPVPAENPQAQAAADMTPLPQPAAGAPMPQFAWPVEGKILSAFGAKPNGQFNDGINIAARTGQPVRAAADGEIVYADNRLKGFGNLLLIRHKHGWLTAYAHNETLLVKKGMQVQRGEVVARAGATGAVRAPQLHFEIRHHRKPVNPLRVLPDRSQTQLTSLHTANGTSD